MPKISVVMPTYNAEKYLKEAVDSILAQTFSDFELLVVDDNSTDKTIEILKSYNDDRIKIIQGDKKGIAAALNKGIMNAQGEYIARMDADDISLPQRFALEVDFLDKNKDISLVGSWQKYIDNGSCIHKPLETPDEVKVAILFRCDLCHSTIMFRKNDFIENNLFYDETSPQEDFELWSRAVHLLKFANIQKVLGLYRVTGQSITDAKRDILADYESSVCVSRLKQYLHIDVEKKDYELLINWTNVFSTKSKKEKKDYLRRLDSLYNEIESANKKYNVYNPQILNKLLKQKFTKNCHGEYFLYPSKYIYFDLQIITMLLNKMLSTSIYFSDKYSIVSVFGLRLYKKTIENDLIIRKYCGVLKTTQSLQKKKKVLIIRLGAIGDVVHSTIMAQAIKNRYPQHELHYLTANYITSLVACSPFVDKVIGFDEKQKNNFFYLLKLGMGLRKEKYDVVFNLTNSSRNIFLCLLSGAKKVIKRNKKRVHAVDAFYNTACDIFAGLEKPKNLKLIVSEDLREEIQKKVECYPKPYFVISPGGANDSERQGRIWAENCWIELSNRLVEQYGGTVFVCGSKSEAENHSIYSKINNSILFSGKLNLTESTALYSLADVFISGDSGPLHISSALGIKSVGLYGSTSPVSCAPYGDNGYCVESLYDCRFCGKKVCEKLEFGEKITPCMKAVSVDSVFELVKKIMDRG